MTDEQIIEKIGFTNAADAIKERAINAIRGVVQLRVIGVVDASMDEEKSKAFESVQTDGDPQIVWDWLRENIAGVDMSEIYDAILADYLEEYLAAHPAS